MGIAFVLILFHWFGDFVLQDEKWALVKSNNWKDLLSHTSLYSGVMALCAMLCSLDVVGGMLFGVITFVCHTATDYFTSRIVSRQFKEGHHGSEIPNFGAFTTIGLDQVLHYAQLFITFHILFLTV